MDLKQAAQVRNSVRAYLEKPLSSSTKAALEKKIAEVNKKSGLHIQLVTDEPKAFDSFMAHYGKFSGVKNYIAMIGKTDKDLQEKCGYYGEELVLFAKTLGLGTCWVALTYKKISAAYTLDEGEKLVLVIAIGHGANDGTPHINRPRNEVAEAPVNAPSWFWEGIEGALLAPTALNQQKFRFTLTGANTVKAEAGRGFYSKIDLGIAKYHFELFAGKQNFEWAK